MYGTNVVVVTRYQLDWSTVDRSVVWTDCKRTSPDIRTESDCESDGLILGVFVVAAEMGFFVTRSPRTPDSPMAGRTGWRAVLLLLMTSLTSVFVDSADAVWKSERHLAGGWKEHSASGFGCCR